MLKYRITPYQTSRHRLKIEVVFPCDANITELLMSAWRPGRYEEGNFTRLVTHFQVFDDQSQRRNVEKTGKNSWNVETKGTRFITVTYVYMGNVLNAGSTYLDEQSILINPVNSLVYNNINYKGGIHLRIETGWEAVGVSSNNPGEWYFESFDRMFDQPIFCSSGIKTLQYSVQEIPFYLHLWAMPDIPEDRLLSDFKAFTELQIRDFGAFPAQAFHFMLLGTEQHYLHGVEHLNSTVIVLGPNQKFTETYYFRLLSVASHELYHVWNIKTIRPKELIPYQYQTLNYSRLGYIYEGVTTYLGDLYLMRSGVISPQKYLDLLADLIQQHIDNSGRYSLSLADSSVDTWVDGYVRGTPGRKVSIYNEGALIAFMLDVQLRSSTNNKVRLETFMRHLFMKFGKNQEGYQQQDLYDILFELSAYDFVPFFNRYVHKANGYESGIAEALEAIGLEMQLKPPASKFVAATGIRILQKDSQFIVHSLADGGPGYIGGLCEDDILLRWNGQAFTKELVEAFFEKEEILEVSLTVLRNHKEYLLLLPMVQRTFFPKVELFKRITEDKRVLKNRQLFGL